jgi:3,4-dihydroxy 2-butanone 4-phosphate synthase/GTP cyclohydrolase II
MTDDLRHDPHEVVTARGDGVTVEWVSAARIPTIFGEFRGEVFRDSSGSEHLALHMGAIANGEPILVRVHSECLTGDILASLRCDCGNQLHDALERIAVDGVGLVVYLRGHEGRGIGIGHKIAAYALQDAGHDTVDANLELGLPVDDRDYTVGAKIIEALGVAKVKLLTNNLDKLDMLQMCGIEVVERVQSEASPNPENVAYLRTKKLRMGHLISGIDD